MVNKGWLLLLILTVCFVMIVVGELFDADIERELRLLAVGRKDIPKSRVSNIMKAMKTRPALKSIVTNELMLRKLYTRKLDDSCTYDKATVDKLAMPPKGQAEYLIWQKSFIDAKIALCDPIEKSVACSPRGCKCEKSTISRDLPDPTGAIVKTCVLGLGDACRDIVPPIYYDPLSLAKDDDPIMSGSPAVNDKTVPKCPPSTEAKSDGPQPLPCTKLDYFVRPACLDTGGPDTSISSLRRFMTASDTARKLSTLGPEDSCDPANTKKFLLEPNNVDYRKAENAILTELKDPLCDLRKLVSCTDTSKCTCLEPTVLNPATKICEIPAWKICGKRGTLEQVTAYFKDKQVGNNGGNTLNEGLENAPCITQSSCVLASEEPVVGYSVCACKGRNVGRNCEIELSNYLVDVKPINYPQDVEDFEERLSIFTKLNENVVGIQKLMTLTEGSPCEEPDESTIQKVFKFTQTISVNGADQEEYEKNIDMAGQVIKKSKGRCNLMDMNMCGAGICKKDVKMVMEMMKKPNPITTTEKPDTEELVKLDLKVGNQGMLGQPCKMSCLGDAKCVDSICKCVPPKPKEHDGFCMKMEGPESRSGGKVVASLLVITTTTTIGSIGLYL